MVNFDDERIDESMRMLIKEIHEAFGDGLIFGKTMKQLEWRESIQYYQKVTDKHFLEYNYIDGFVNCD